MKLKRIIALLVLVVTLFSLTGCIILPESEVTIDCVTYTLNGGVSLISTRNIENPPERIYVKDEINGKPVVSGVGYYNLIHVNAENSERVYFP